MLAEHSQARSSGAIIACPYEVCDELRASDSAVYSIRLRAITTVVLAQAIEAACAATGCWTCTKICSGSSSRRRSPLMPFQTVGLASIRSLPSLLHVPPSAPAPAPSPGRFPARMSGHPPDRACSPARSLHLRRPARRAHAAAIPRNGPPAARRAARPPTRAPAR